jgi:hypothetical protein
MSVEDEIVWFDDEIYDEFDSRLWWLMDGVISRKSGTGESEVQDRGQQPM